MFKRIMDEKPEVMKKLYPVWGEITLPNFGLNDEHLKRVTENTHVMFHLAASLKLEATLKPNILMNLTGTKYVLELAKQMKNLIQMIHTSTAFCNVEHAIMEEKVYDAQHQPEDLIRCAEWMSEESMAVAQKEILGIHPNTYTYTKRLAEILVRDEYNKGTLPVSIVRPSIVCPAFKDPLPGWVNTCNFVCYRHLSFTLQLLFKRSTRLMARLESSWLVEKEPFAVCCSTKMRTLKQFRWMSQ